MKAISTPHARRS